jgi:hypothetical protein
MEGPLAAWIWDRRGARVEGSLREVLLHQRHRGRQLLEVHVAEGGDLNRVEAIMEAMQKQHRVLYRIVLEAGQVSRDSFLFA